MPAEFDVAVRRHHINSRHNTSITWNSQPNYPPSRIRWQRLNVTFLMPPNGCGTHTKPLRELWVEWPKSSKAVSHGRHNMQLRLFISLSVSATFIRTTKTVPLEHCAQQPTMVRALRWHLTTPDKDPNCTLFFTEDVCQTWPKFVITWCWGGTELPKLLTFHHMSCKVVSPAILDKANRARQSKLCVTE